MVSDSTRKFFVSVAAAAIPAFAFPAGAKPPLDEKSTPTRDTPGGKVTTKPVVKPGATPATTTRKPATTPGTTTVKKPTDTPVVKQPPKPGKTPAPKPGAKP